MEDKLDQAIEALKTYDWGTDRGPVKPIEEAVVATYGDAGARKDLEAKLAAVLKTDVSYDAKDYVCRQLRTIGTAASVPTLAGQLADEEYSHMARYALERIPAPEAGKALRDALGKLKGELKIGVICSLGQRYDTASIGALGGLLGDGDAAVARAAALSLGTVCTADAAKALARAKPSSAVTDASFACAEALIAAGKKSDALAIYKRFLGSDQPNIKLAATRGVLACS